MNEIEDQKRREQMKQSWWGLRCWLRVCGGFIGTGPGGVYWQCTNCDKRDYAHEEGWDYLPEDGPKKGPVR